MSFGLQFKNDDNQVIVDADFHHYHYAGKATYIETVRIPAIVGGNDTAHSYTSYQSLSSNQTRGDIIKYRISVGRSGSAAPMCFIKPSSTGSSSPYCGIVLTYKYSSTVWEIWVLQDYNNTRPDLYCFLPLNDMTDSQKSVSGSQSVITFNSSRSKTYDARLKPLKIVGAITTTAPSVARTGTISNSYSPYFAPDQVNSNSFTTSTTESNANDLIFYCPSLAHACQSTDAFKSGDGFQAKGYNSYYYKWAREDRWWTFYRNTFRFRSKTNFQSSYTEYACGHIWGSVEKQASLLGLIIGAVAGFFVGGFLAAGLGILGGAALSGAFSGVGAVSGLYFPYENDGRNQSQVQPVLISKASFYD